MGEEAVKNNDEAPARVAAPIPRITPGGRRRAALAQAAQAKPAIDETEQQKVVQIVRWMEQEATLARAKKIKPWLLISVLACILLPTVLAGLYFFFVAADQYVSEARFAVRSNEGQSADVLGMISGMPRATVISDSYIVADFVRSSEMVAELERRIPLRGVYARPEADFLTRLDGDASREDLVDYWNGRVDVGYDSTKNTIAVQVRAFSPQDSQRIVSEIVEIARELINNLSAQSRRDAVQFAAAEVARAELRVRGTRQDILKFQTENNNFDPSQTAAASLGIVAELQSELSRLNSQLASVSSYLNSDAPTVAILEAKIQALEEEIGRKERQFSATDEEPGTANPAQPANRALASVVSQYQELMLDREFAEKAYAAALASLERARTEADRTQSYLAIYMHPTAAESATYPNSLLNTFMIFVFACVIWGVGSLGWLSVRDHMS